MLSAFHIKSKQMISPMLCLVGVEKVGSIVLVFKKITLAQTSDIRPGNWLHFLRTCDYFQQLRMTAVFLSEGEVERKKTPVEPLTDGHDGTVWVWNEGKKKRKNVVR